MSLRDLYDQFRTFGVVKDVCVTERPSAEQSSRHKKHERLAIVEFQKKWSADKFLSKQKRHPFFEGIDVQSYPFELKENCKNPAKETPIHTPKTLEVQRTPLGYTRIE